MKVPKVILVGEGVFKKVLKLHYIGNIESLSYSTNGLTTGVKMTFQLVYNDGRSKLDASPS